jgi:hypothetical protein
VKAPKLLERAEALYENAIKASLRGGKLLFQHVKGDDGTPVEGYSVINDKWVIWEEFAFWSAAWLAVVYSETSGFTNVDEMDAKVRQEKEEYYKKVPSLRVH